MYKISKKLSFEREKTVIIYNEHLDFSIRIWYADSVGACLQ